MFWAAPCVNVTPAYKEGKVSEDDMCGEMVTMHRGMLGAVLDAARPRDFSTDIRFRQIFPEMRELVRRLQENGCELWAVSSSNEWVIRAGMKHFGIPEDRDSGAKVDLDAGIVTDRLSACPQDRASPRLCVKWRRNQIDAAFGNSRWDKEMLEMAAHAFAVNPNPDLEAVAREQGWKIYFPDGTRPRA